MNDLKNVRRHSPSIKHLTCWWCGGNLICSNVHIYFLSCPCQAGIPKRIFSHLFLLFFLVLFFISFFLSFFLLLSQTPVACRLGCWPIQTARFSAAKRQLAAALWSLQYFLCGHTIKDLGGAIGRMWKLDPGSIHPTNSLFLSTPFSFFF